MKKIVILIILFGITAALVYFAEPIQNWIIKQYIYNDPIVIEKQNDYSLNKVNRFVKITNNCYFTRYNCYLSILC